MIKKIQDPLVHKFSELLRKMYSPKNFKGHVDPHELLHVS